MERLKAIGEFFILAAYALSGMGLVTCILYMSFILLEQA